MRQTVELLTRTLTNQELVTETGQDVLWVINDYVYGQNGDGQNGDGFILLLRQLGGHDTQRS